MIRAIVTVGYVGTLPKAPGTWGSLVAIPLAWVLHAMGGVWLLIGATLALAALGLWASGQYLEGRAEDPGEVVIDELVGMMITLWPLSWGLTMAGTDPWVFPWPGWVIGFLLFRALDILKPPPIRWFDRPGPVGIMMDDIAAGAIAACLVWLAARIAHGEL